jgi:hypothetical protein
VLEAVFACPYCLAPHPEGTRTNKKYCSTRCGNNARNEKWNVLNREKYLQSRRATNAKRRATPKGKWVDHKHRAKQSGIDFNLSFEEWWQLWEPHWEDRGIGGLVMCRTNDSGAYELGNVRIDTQANNNREACLSGGRAKC